MLSLLTLPRGPAPAEPARPADEREPDAFGIVIRPAPSVPGRDLAPAVRRPRLRVAMAMG